jgi:hypothetical protein
MLLPENLGLRMARTAIVAVHLSKNPQSAAAQDAIEVLQRNNTNVQIGDVIRELNRNGPPNAFQDAFEAFKRNSTNTAFDGVSDAMRRNTPNNVVREPVNPTAPKNEAIVPPPEEKK